MSNDAYFQRMISNVFKCVSICFEFASTAEWQQLTHWVNTKAGIKFQNHSKQSLWDFLYTKKNCTLQEILFPPIKRLEKRWIIWMQFSILQKKLEGTTKKRKVHNLFMEIFFSFFTRDMYPWLYPLIDEAMLSKCSLAKTTSPSTYFYST